VLSRAQALSSGYHRTHIDHRLRSGRWRAILPGIYLTTNEAMLRDLLRAALLYAGAHSSISGAYALHLHGLRMRRPPHILVLAERRRRPTCPRWLHIRPTTRLPQPHWYRGLAIAPLPRAVADWALQARDLDEVRAVVARVIQRRQCQLAELSTELAAGPRNGSALFRRALTEITAGARSAPEARAASALKRARLGPFEQNASIDRYIVDFLWRELRAVLEIDSVEYHFDAHNWAATLSRHRELESLGYSVIHIRPAELTDEVAFVDSIRRWLAARRRLINTAPAALRYRESGLDQGG
jgi:very-short-patch-repair endonuclease